MEKQSLINQIDKTGETSPCLCDGLLYLLVTYGEKPTGGYDVEITAISEKENKLVVTAHFTEPGKDDIVTEALTYPYDLAMLEDPGLPVRFEATGAETEVPGIQ